MDLNLSEELQLLQATVRRFVSDQLVPLEREYADRPLPKAVRDGVVGQIRDLGLWAAAAPERLGGGGLGAQDHGIVLEEVGRSILEGCQAGQRLFGGNPPYVLLSESGPELESAAKAIVEGRSEVAYAPPRAGDEPTLRARTEGDSVVLDGRVPLVENWARAGQLLLRAVGDSGPVFALAERDTSGISVQDPFTAFGGTGDERVTVVVEGLRVPKSRLVDDRSGGLFDHWLSLETLRSASGLVGLVERAVGMARDYAKQRVTFGAPLSTRQAIQWKLVDADMDLYASRWMVRHALWSADEGRVDSALAAKVRLHVFQAAWRSIDDVLQVFGGIGFTQDMPIEAMWRYIRANVDRFGSLEASRAAVARSLATASSSTN